MTIKRKKGNLKRLFLFNGLIFIIALLLIQYSVVMHKDEADQNIAENASSIQAEYEAALQQNRLELNPVLRGQVAQRVTMYDQPKAFANIEFKTAFNKSMKMDDLKGQWVVLNLWATWCPPCLKEMPSLQALEDQYGGQGVKVVAISLDRGMNGKILRSYLADKGFGPVAAYYADYLDVKERVDINGLPNTFILSPNGQAVAVAIGDLDWVSADSKAFIESLVQ